jgi:hypothetical protein
MNDWTVIFWTLLIIVTVSSGIAFAPYKEALNECEKNLPRNKHCVLTAIPEDNKGETK